MKGPGIAENRVAGALEVTVGGLSFPKAPRENGGIDRILAEHRFVAPLEQSTGPVSLAGVR